MARTSFLGTMGSRRPSRCTYGPYEVVPATGGALRVMTPFAYPDGAPVSFYLVTVDDDHGRFTDRRETVARAGLPEGALLPAAILSELRPLLGDAFVLRNGTIWRPCLWRDVRASLVADFVGVLLSVHARLTESMAFHRPADTSISRNAAIDVRDHFPQGV